MKIRYYSASASPDSKCTYIHINVIFIERSGRKQIKSAGRLWYRHHMLPVDFSLDLNKPSISIERKPGLKKFQAKGAETEKSRDAKVEVTAGL